MSEKEQSTGVFIIAILLLVPMLLWRGWVTVMLWNWFMVVEPIGAPVLPMAHIMGIALLIGCLTKEMGPKQDRHEAIKHVGYALGGPALALLLGWILKAFMS